MEIIDLTQIFNSHMPVFPGDPEAELVKIADVAKDGTTNHQLISSMHVGTHIDAPAHMIEDGKLISDYPPEKFFGRGVLVDVRDKSLIDEKALDSLKITSGDIILFQTGWAKNFNQPDYFKNYQQLTEGLAKKLAALGVSMVGMDTPSPDVAPYPIHKILLPKDILIIENLTNLDLLIGKSFEVVALPLKIEANASLARVVAKIINE